MVLYTKNGKGVKLGGSFGTLFTKLYPLSFYFLMWYNNTFKPAIKTARPHDRGGDLAGCEWRGSNPRHPDRQPNELRYRCSAY